MLSNLKEDVSLKLLEFLQSPHATTEVLLAEKEQRYQIEGGLGNMDHEEQGVQPRELTGSSRFFHEMVKGWEMYEIEDAKTELRGEKRKSGAEVRLPFLNVQICKRKYGGLSVK